MSEKNCEQCLWKNVPTKGCVKGQPVEVQCNPKACDFFKKADSKNALKSTASEE